MYIIKTIFQAAEQRFYKMVVERENIYVSALDRRKIYS